MSARAKGRSPHRLSKGKVNKQQKQPQNTQRCAVASKEKRQAVMGPRQSCGRYHCYTQVLYAALLSLVQMLKLRFLSGKASLPQPALMGMETKVKRRMRLNFLACKALLVLLSFRTSALAVCRQGQQLPVSSCQHRYATKLLIHRCWVHFSLRKHSSNFKHCIRACCSWPLQDKVCICG